MRKPKIITTLRAYSSPLFAFIVVVFSVIAEFGYDGLVIATFMAGSPSRLRLVRIGNLVAFVPEAVGQRDPSAG